MRIRGGVLSVGHDQTLYEKYKNHGPIVVYEQDFHDAEATLVFRLIPDQTTKQPARGAFTFDGETGHVLRVYTSIEQPGRVGVWHDGDKKPVILTRDLPKVEPGEWTTLKIVVKGSEAEIALGGKSVTVEHPALERAKTNAKYSAAFSTMELDDFKLRAE